MAGFTREDIMNTGISIRNNVEICQLCYVRTSYFEQCSICSMKMCNDCTEYASVLLGTDEKNYNKLGTLCKNCDTKIKLDETGRINGSQRTHTCRKCDQHDYQYHSQVHECRTCKIPFIKK